jgi:hypothetical protein
VSLKSLTTGVAAATLVGAAAVGVTSVASVPTTVSPAITPVVFGAPLPLDSDPALTGEFTGILNQLANTGTISDKGYLVEGGIGILEGRTADRLLRNAAQKGDLPLSFNLTPPAVNGNTATTTVTVTGPSIPAPVSQPVTFVNNGGNWLLSKSSATSLLQAAMASG